MTKNTARRHRNRAHIRAKKGTVCQDCGGTFSPEDLWFVHRDPTKARFTLGSIRGLDQGISAIDDEIMTCDVLCRWCQAERVRVEP